MNVNNNDFNCLNLAQKALAAREYESAIAQFEQICQNSHDQTLISTAKKGLVSAYIKSGKAEKAIQLCEEIQQTGDISNQVWARRQLKELKTAERLSETTGFVVDTAPPDVSPPPVKKRQSFKKETPPETPKKKPISSPKTEKKTAKKKQEKKNKAKPKPLKELSKPSIKREWRDAPSAENWQPLSIKFQFRFWLRIAISIVAFFWLFRASIEIFMGLTNDLLVSLPDIRPFQPFYRDPTITLIIFLVIVCIISPWWLDGVMSILYQRRKLSLSEFLTRCPDSGKILRNYCRQHKIPFPYLGLLHITSPVIFSYGHLPKNTRIIVSEGLLSQLEDEEIATLLAGELAMSRYGLFPILSSAIAFLQIPYSLYYQIAYWGEKSYQKIPKRSPRFIPNWIWRDIPPLIRNSGAIISNFFYLAYRLWQLPLNWIFQAQHFYRDQFSVSLTGNPNAKVRALIKLTFGMTHGIEVEKQTPYFLESFNPLFPIGYRQGLSLGSLSEHIALETILNWELSQPYRHYLNSFHSHPPISDRAFNLLQFATKYQLPLELEITNPHPSSRSWIDQIKTLISAYRVFPLLQKSVYLGIILGVILRLIFWGMGIISEQLDFFYLSWLTEAETILNGSILFAFSLSLLIGINHYFPNLKLSKENNNPNLSQWLTQMTHPQEVASLRIEGQLLGRSGISNWLGQDLILKTKRGIIPLHFSSRLGIIGNTLPNFSRPNQFIQKPVIVSGWLRRGVIPWLDVERITYNQRHSIQAHYPIWVTMIAVGAAIWGAQLILQA
ncbi:hypothetical protein FRE64_14970 [Euhalothece natronophila Z-M001]|uniref:Peptidase M48 domain-containing protein n=1 Tax=Euhalothece natronophila Z-M001 TaxID=522448 RepID=A0A5B8NQ23_9CHRO|nr:M48 family metalloprotease [Euhalothece natronophila]QDZ41128.1 hypothetical protein FRE64_14970 [Euhalothece natronophila Z-M001]